MVWVEHIATNIKIKMKTFKDPHQILQVWFSSSFPIGSYAYSHGLEALIDDKKIKNNNDVKEFLDALLFYGTLRNDYIFMKSIYKGEEINELILASAASKVKEINALYDSLSSNLSEINSSTGSMNIPEGLGEELTQMKKTINELNAKYAAMLEGMK